MNKEVATNKSTPRMIRSSLVSELPVRAMEFPEAEAAKNKRQKVFDDSQRVAVLDIKR